MDENDFGAFWQAYPKKLAKGDARKAWEQTKKIRPAIAVLLKALAYSRGSDQWRRDGGQYVPYPATWLRQERWEDVHEVELGQVVDGRCWWETSAGVENKARELGFDSWNGSNYPTWQAWAESVKERAMPNVVQIDKKMASGG